MENCRLHHCALNITTDSLEDVLEMCTIFDCYVVYRPNNEFRWAMICQKGLQFAIQIVETTERPISDLETKKNTHLAFLSDNPQEIIDKIEDWAKNKNILFVRGKWSEKELFFDLPNLFINFVVEVMHTSIDEG